MQMQLATAIESRYAGAANIHASIALGVPLAKDTAATAQSMKRLVLAMFELAARNNGFWTTSDGDTSDFCT